MIALAPISTCPPRVAALATITRSPTWQSWATWQYAMRSTPFPTRVTPPPATVPRFTVTYSRMVHPSPISTRVSSPRYFTSCGGAPIDAKEYTRVPFPIRAWHSMTACAPILHPSPSVTWGPTTAYAPTSTPFPSVAPGSMIAVG